MALAPLPTFASSTTQVVAGPAFGGWWRVVLSSDEDMAAVRRAVLSVTDHVDAAMSPWRQDSAISRFNGSASTAWQTIGTEAAFVTEEALRIADLSQGAFDPTVGPLVSRFGFGPIAGSDRGYRGLETRPGELRKATSGLTVDLCGIAKGHALDRAGEALRGLGIENALLEIGGEVLSLGTHPSGRSWQVAVETPGSQPFAVQRVVTPENLALATSGHAPQGHIGARGELSHLIDPSAGRPAKPALGSVSVLSHTGCRADALATALTVLGPEHGPELAEQMGVSALFLIRQGSSVRERLTGDFASHIIA